MGTREQSFQCKLFVLVRSLETGVGGKLYVRLGLQLHIVTAIPLILLSREKRLHGAAAVGVPAFSGYLFMSIGNTRFRIKSR